MPKTNYQNTIIYKIYSKDESITEIYIGHTTNLKARKNHHKSNCHNEKSKLYNLKVYCYIRENGGWNNFNMIEIEKFACNNIKEASLKECYWIKELKANLNNNIPGRTDKEWREDNKKIIAEKAKDYRKNNKEKLAEHQKNRKDKKERSEKRKEIIKCECGCEITKGCLSRHLKSAKHKEHKNNKEKAKETIICECGCKVTKCNLNRHLKTVKHQLLMNFKNEQFNNDE